ncbi:hypothetical protein JOF53_001617 [Crossiella equi]|uniref:Secreted protein n=1 Tax=Crossiella equi TaxID=130796 RepID=A0ABS5A844_9PSEU|nr:hypothetical protein [Crossiella equi]MBP2472745.1 hypothetical protein [Crossiella equi]
MTKRLSTMFVTAIAGGALFLGSAGVALADEGIDPVNCGEVTMPWGAAHNLIADVTEGGRVGCTEAFNVFDEYTKLSPEKRAEASLHEVELTNGWWVTVDDGEIASLMAWQGDGAQRVGFHTEPV